MVQPREASATTTPCSRSAGPARARSFPNATVLTPASTASVAMADHNPSPAPEALGPALLELIEKLYPICRSITGEGVRETLRILSSYFDLEIQEVPSGTEVLDWTVPREWNIRDAWIKNQ